MWLTYTMVFFAGLNGIQVDEVNGENDNQSSWQTYM